MFNTAIHLYEAFQPGVSVLTKELSWYKLGCEQGPGRGEWSGGGMRGTWLWLKQGRPSPAFTLACTYGGWGVLWGTVPVTVLRTASLAVYRAWTRRWNIKQESIFQPVWCNHSPRILYVCILYKWATFGLHYFVTDRANLHKCHYIILMCPLLKQRLRNIWFTQVCSICVKKSNYNSREPCSQDATGQER